MQTVTTQGPSPYRRVKDLHVLNVKGSAYEMGRQHGALLGKHVASGPLLYYRRMVERLLGKPLGPLAPLLTEVLQRGVGARVRKGIPSFAEDAVRGLAEGAGLDFDELARGATMPDSLVWIVSLLMRAKDPGPALAHRIALGLGCTSAVAWGGATRDGMLYHARNFDYHGVGIWPEHAALIFHQPDRGNRYLSVAAAGVVLGGITAMNEAGLTLTVHQHMFTPSCRLGGTPIGVAGDQVMREARDLDEAERILSSQRPIGCWTYVIADARGEVLCFEENPERRVAHRIKDGTFGYANVYLDAALGRTERAMYGTYWRHNMGRHARVNQLLSELSGTLDARGMAGILADTGDSRCRVRNSICMSMTVGSVIFRPQDGVVWVGTGQAPTSAGTFVPFSLARQGHAPELGEIAIDKRTDDFEAYERAFIAYSDDNDVAAARASMDRARALAPSQPVYHALAGILSIELGDAEGACARLDRAIDLGHPDEERAASFYLWRGRAHDLAGRRHQARADYRACLASKADPPAHAAARKNERRAFSRNAARRIQIDMGLGDVAAP